MTIKSEIAKQSSMAKSINQWLESPNAAFSIRQAQLLLRLEKDWQLALNAASATAFRNASSQARIAGLTDNELTVLVQTAATRAKITMLAPALAESLRLRGWQISRIRIRVQELVIRQQAQAARLRRLIAPESARAIEHTAMAIHHPGIRKALEHLATAHTTKGVG